jgi:hypothetical protein
MKPLPDLYRGLRPLAYDGYINQQEEAMTRNEIEQHVAGTKGEEPIDLKVEMCQKAINALQCGWNSTVGLGDGAVIWPEGVANRFNLWPFINEA